MKHHYKSKKSRKKDFKRIQANNKILKIIESSQTYKMKKKVEKLSSMCLFNKPEKKIREELDKIKGLPFMTTIFHKGKEIERAVPNTKNEPIFESVSRISYKPLKYNTNYQRASTPKNTMFYGCVIPENPSENEIQYARIVSSAETCELLRNENAADGNELITFGKWIVKEDLNLATIVNPYEKYKIQSLAGLVAEYQNCLNTLPNDCYLASIYFLKFITKEFSKKVDKGKNYEYIISAIFTEILVSNPNNDIDGIIYPSVQVGKEGLCVAICPKSMKKLELFKVLQCEVIRKGKKVCLNNIRFTSNIRSDGTFDLEDI